MAEVLEVLHLAKQHGMAEVEIGRGRIEADFDDERLALGDFGLEIAGADDVHASFGEIAS
jgi:hypothetical protein